MLTISRYLDVARATARVSDVTTSAPSRYGGGGKPPVVVWNLTRRCNQRCAHCYADAAATPSEGELSTGECRRILSEMAEAGVPVVIFSGGEPMLRRDLVELVAWASEVGVRPQLSSNGTLADKTILSALKDAGLGYFGVSIDGSPAFNDAFRGMPRGWDRATRGLLAAREVGLRTGLRMTVTNDNAHEVDGMLHLAEEVGATRFYVSHLQDSGRGEDVAALGPAETRRLLIGLFELARDARDRDSPVDVVTGGNESAGPLLVAWVRDQYGSAAAERLRRMLAARGGNSAGVALLNIDEEGEVHPDQFWRDASLGNLHDTSFDDVLEHPLRAKLSRRQELLTGRCGACRFLDLCGGGHRERAAARTGNPWGPDPACVMTPSEIKGRVQRDRAATAAARSQA